MKRFDRMGPRGYASAAVIVLAVLAWPSAGWSRTAGRNCDVEVARQLQNWARQLKASSDAKNPADIVGTYARTAVLVPTCKNGPYTGSADITKYFADFIKHEPEVTLDAQDAKIGGDCKIAFASGLYTFKIKYPAVEELPARYTFIFQRHKASGPWPIAQHHSSLQMIEPEPKCPPPIP